MCTKRCCDQVKLIDKPSYRKMQLIADVSNMHMEADRNRPITFDASTYLCMFVNAHCCKWMLV